MDIETQKSENIVYPAKGRKQLLGERPKEVDLPQGNLLKFCLSSDLEGYTVYNPSPMVIEGKTYLWARVEKRDVETGSMVMLFEEDKKGEWNVVKGSPQLTDIQDPFYCGIIEGYHVFGGIQIYDDGSGHIGYRTALFKFQDNFSEKPFFVGPPKMKGIRLIEISKGRIGVFTRPQGEFGGRGQVGYFEANNLDELEDKMSKHVLTKDPASLIPNLFLNKLNGEGMWGGFNQLFNRSDGNISVIGHIADFDDYTENSTPESKVYDVISCIFHPDKTIVSDVKIVATAQQFSDVIPKTPQLKDVVYPGGLVPINERRIRLYVGVGDVASGSIDLDNPFPA